MVRTDSVISGIKDYKDAKGPLLCADGTPLKQRIKKAERTQKIRAALLVLPLLGFIVLTFIMPIGSMLMRSIDNSIVPNTLPRTVVALKTWDSRRDTLPDEAVYNAFAHDLLEAKAARRHSRVGSRLNYEQSGASSLFRKTGRKVTKFDFEAPLKPQLIAADKGWGRPEIWRSIQIYSKPYTSGYYATAIDLKLTSDGYTSVGEDRAIYIKLFTRTFFMSLLITFLCFVIGYPLAYLLSILPMRTSNLLMILVLLPFWTSLLVRTSAWKVLLQEQGVINDLLVWLGLIADHARLQLINNQTGTIIAMTHILLPFMILPLYSVMKTISPSYMRAARSLGATNFYAFWRVYFPNTIAGVGAGAILVFILAIGYYITPELVGGQSGTFISNRIAYHISSSLNWGLGAALGAILLFAVLILYWLYDRIVGIDNMKLG